LCAGALGVHAWPSLDCSGVRCRRTRWLARACDLGVVRSEKIDWRTAVDVSPRGKCMERDVFRAAGAGADVAGSFSRPLPSMNRLFKGLLMCGAGAGVLLAAPFAWGHGSEPHATARPDLWKLWSFEPGVVIPMVVAAILYGLG